MKDKILDSKAYIVATQIIIALIRIVEIALAAVVVLGVVLTIIDIVSSNALQNLEFQYGYFSYKTFQEFLAFVLILVVGLELAIMLVKHTAESVVEVILYAVARKMLIYNTSSVEILLGVITLAILYGIKIYMLKDNNDKIRKGVYTFLKKIRGNGFDKETTKKIKEEIEEMDVEN